MRTQSYFTRSRVGFTLVELLVSMAILTLLMLVLVSVTDATQRTWSYTTGKIEQFRDAREAFESITRKLSQATLNTYWDYEYPTDASGKPDTTQTPVRYIRQSELRFISGKLNTITGTTKYPAAPTHAVFFQAPLGYVDNADYSSLNNLLNTWGYFVEFGSDRPWRPDFINTSERPPAERYRFRLLEMMEPSETLRLYDAEAKAGGNSKYNTTQWFTDSLDLQLPPNPPPNRPVRVVADNVIALVLLPKLTPKEEDSPDKVLSPFYSYDSTKTNSRPTINPKNQLPPVVQVTMVAVDEASFNRLQGAGDEMPDLFRDSSGRTLFETVGDTVDSTRPGYAKDLEALQRNLRDNKLNYRVFSTNVSIKAAKWSREQVN